MPYLKLKQPDARGNTKKYYSKHHLKELKKPEPWNPDANGKIIEDGGRMYQILPTGWKRRKDLEQLEDMKLKVSKATDTKEKSNGLEANYK